MQTGLDEDQAHRAEKAASDLLAEVGAQAAVVTLGALGAVAQTSAGAHRVQARRVAVADTHGAGAAFSAGLALAYLRAYDTPSALRLACDLGTEHCAAPFAIPALPHPAVPKERTAR